MTALDRLLAECERLDKEATKGPWRWVGVEEENMISSRGADALSGPGGYGDVLDYAGCGSHRIAVAPGNEAFIAAARTSLPKLARIVRVLREHANSQCECVRLGKLPGGAFDCAKFPCISGRALAEAERIAGSDE